MAVMRDNFSAWPDSVAFKRMLRSLVRAQQYVPPQQPTGTGPAGQQAAATDETVRPAAPPVLIGNWTLDQNSAGDLIATHRSGAETTLARAPETDQ